MDIYQALKKDHRKAKALFAKLLKTTMEDKEREETFEKLKTILASHHDAEEKVLYVALEENESSEDRIENALEQHKEVVYILEEIQEIDAEDENWKEKMIELHDYFQEHIKLEEGEIFQEARKIFSEDQAKELAHQFVEIKGQN